ncbi:MAG: GtrA family protein [Saprospiraceae bacterium]|nr:GtrA family protein [Saprospiraceae bacterium]
MIGEKWQKLLLLKSKFLLTSGLATAVDIGLYLLLLHQWGLQPVVAQSIAFPIAVLLNYLLQKWFIFEGNRKQHTIFILAMAVSGLGYFLSLLLVYGLNQVAVFQEHQLLLKVTEKGILFFYNFYLKRFAFEKKLV